MFGKFPKKILGVILGLAVVAASVAKRNLGNDSQRALSGKFYNRNII